MLSTNADQRFSLWEQASPSFVKKEARKHRQCWLESVGSTGLGAIRLTLSRSIAYDVIKEITTTDLIVALSGMYEKPSTNNNMHLMKNYSI